MDQLKPIFAQCAKSHKDKTLQESCKTFLEKEFPNLEKKWNPVLKGGFRLTSLGKLSDKDRFSLLGFEDNIPNMLRLNNRYPVDKFEYSILSLPEF